MRDRLDAARMKLSTVTPDLTAHETERIVRQLAAMCSVEDLAGLIGDALDVDQQARKELAYSAARLVILTRARTFKRQKGV